MKLSAWAKLQGIHYQTAWRMWKKGILPVAAEQLQTGTVIVHAEPGNDLSKLGVALYARVSGSDQKADLDRQLLRLTEYAIANKLVIVDAVREIGSGLNGRRKNMLRLLANVHVHTILVEHRDRLTRYGFEYIEAALAAQQRRVLVIEPDEISEDIVRDMTEVLTSMCARLYGKRSARRRAQRAMAVIDE